MPGFTKPTVLIRDAKVAIYNKLGKPVPADTRRGFTDHMEFLSSTVLIGYKKYPNAANYPTAAMKAAALAGAELAKRIVRKANDEFAGILMLRKKESPLFQQVMDAHFGLIAGDTSGDYLKDNVVNKKFSLKAVTERDRRWVLEKIRQKMLSLSFHLNTGVYLIDTDAARRDIQSGMAFDPANADPNNEAYVSPAKTASDPVTWRTTNAEWSKSLTCGFRHGEIHISLANLENYSPISYARIIIHEAAHKYLGVDDHKYAHSDEYATLSLAQTLDNADSIAWAAVSLYCGSVKMATPASAPTPDWTQCTKP